MGIALLKSGNKAAESSGIRFGRMVVLRGKSSSRTGMVASF
jgi:hypothetical protein